MDDNQTNTFRPRLPEYFQKYIHLIKTLDENDLNTLFNNNHLTARELASEDDIPFNEVSHYWLKQKGISAFVKIDKSKPDFTKNWIKDCLIELNEQFNQPTQFTPIQHEETGKVLRLILTDIHIGLETDQNGYGLYGGIWNEDELEKRRVEVLRKANLLKEKHLSEPFDEIHVIDLGDYMDGWDGTTTRKNHPLPQNMDNRKAFRVGTSFKALLYEDLQKMFNVPLKAYNVVNDNHSADFGYIVNESVKYFCEMRNQNITVNNFERFMQHYYIGDHCFILCHGKDQRHMRFGFKPQLDSSAKEKIEEYIRFHRISEKAKTITFEKGDSHQQMFDFSTSDLFDYMNYRAFSPASDWVQTNCGKGTSGFTFMIVDQNETNHVLYTTSFNWQTNREEIDFS